MSEDRWQEGYDQGYGEGYYAAQDDSDEKLTRYETAAIELLAEQRYILASLLGGRRPSWKHIGHNGRQFWRADADNKIKEAILTALEGAE